MTSKEIKKAFGICCNSTQGCTGCPILKIEEQNGLGCKYNLFINAIGIITKQEEEIKNLKTQLEQPRKETEKEILQSGYVYDTTRGNKINLIEMAREIERKETAKEILNRINEYNLNYNWDLKEEFKKLCKDYDVEVEDE